MKLPPEVGSFQEASHVTAAAGGYHSMTVPCVVSLSHVGW